MDVTFNYPDDAVIEIRISDLDVDQADAVLEVLYTHLPEDVQQGFPDVNVFIQEEN